MTGFAPAFIFILWPVFYVNVVVRLILPFYWCLNATAVIDKLRKYVMIVKAHLLLQVGFIPNYFGSQIWGWNRSQMCLVETAPRSLSFSLFVNLCPTAIFHTELYT